MKRSIDLSLAIIGFIGLFFPFLIIAIFVYFDSRGPILYWSVRVGRNNRLFKMPKFRSMLINTPTTPTHLLPQPHDWITPFGSFLRRYSLDELPQLWNILKGEMSFVGPRPALFSQVDLIDLRTKFRVHELTPGLTGWAQINGRDEITITEKVKLDSEYLKKKSTLLDMRILWMTAQKTIFKEGISH